MRWLILLCVFTMSALAADVTGEWKASTEGPNGTMERTFQFKVEGGKLTGETVSSVFGKSEIKEGKVDGDTLSFVIEVKFQDNDLRVSYTGKVVSGEEIHLKAETSAGNGRAIEWKAKRTK